MRDKVFLLVMRFAYRGSKFVLAQEFGIIAPHGFEVSRVFRFMPVEVDKGNEFVLTVPCSCPKHCLCALRLTLVRGFGCIAFQVGGVLMAS